MRKFLSSAALAALFLLAAAPLFSQKLEKSLLWEVSGKGLAKPSYLFGTYHVLNDAYMNANQQKALNLFLAADGLVVEMVIDTPAIMAAQRYMVMPENRISKLLDTASYRLVAAEIKAAMGVDLAALDQLKPMVIQTYLTIAYIMQASPEIAEFGGMPLDMFFAEEAAKSGRPVHQLETVEEQMKLLYEHFTLQQQADQLAEMVRLKDKMLASQKQFAQSYLAQDIQALDDETQEMLKVMPTYGNIEYLTVDRNKRWVQKLPALMKEGSLFIAVGALHLPGKDGLIDLLRKAGYKVKAVN